MSNNVVPPLASWDEYRGQTQLKRRLTVHADAALNQGRMLDDILFAAPPGVGKTTLARLLAMQVTDPFKLFMVPQIDIKQFCQFCRRWEGGVILLDELHSAPRKLSELLYSAIGQDNKVLHPPSGPPIEVNHITFMGATTEPDKVHKPLWDRFKIKPRWEDYTDEDMALIVADGARRVGPERRAARRVWRTRWCPPAVTWTPPAPVSRSSPCWTWSVSTRTG
jgi:Holliday junction DNA helicase RuvB